MDVFIVKVTPNIENFPKVGFSIIQFNKKSPFRRHSFTFFIYLVRLWGIEFSNLLSKNATHDNEKFWDLGTKNLKWFTNYMFSCKSSWKIMTFEYHIVGIYLNRARAKMTLTHLDLFPKAFSVWRLWPQLSLFRDIIGTNRWGLLHWWCQLSFKITLVTVLWKYPRISAKL